MGCIGAIFRLFFLILSIAVVFYCLLYLSLFVIGFFGIIQMAK